MMEIQFVLIIVKIYIYIYNIWTQLGNNIYVL